MTASDDELLMNMGYKPELHRSFGLVEVFGFSLSIMSIVPGITAVFVDSLVAGGVGISWGWFVPCFFVTCVALALAELSSAMPTAGGLYWWTYKFAPARLKRPLSFLIGYANILGLIGSICSINYGFATMILSLPAIASEGNFQPTKFEEYGVFAACTLSHLVFSSINTSFVNKVQWFMILSNVVLIFVFVIGLPVGLRNQGKELNSAKWVFGNTDSETDWEYGWAFLLSWMSPIWVISALDACIHLAEEATNAATVIPFGLVSSTTFCWLFGWLVMCVLAAVINQDFSTFADSPTGQPMAQIIWDTMNKRWAMGLMIFMTILQWIVGLSIVTGTSRLTFSFARDNALPFSRLFRKVYNGIPVYANVLNVIISLLISLLILIGGEAATAVFSIPVSSSGLAWFTPIFLRAFIAPKDEWNPGPFYLGDRLSKINAFLACIFMAFVVLVLANMPSVKAVTASTMNYTVVINVAIWVLALIYYFAYAHKDFHGPQITLDTYDGASVPIEEAVLQMPKAEHEDTDTPTASLEEKQ